MWSKYVNVLTFDKFRCWTYWVSYIILFTLFIPNIFLCKITKFQIEEVLQIPTLPALGGILLRG